MITAHINHGLSVWLPNTLTTDYRYDYFALYPRIIGMISSSLRQFIGMLLHTLTINYRYDYCNSNTDHK